MSFLCCVCVCVVAMMIAMILVLAATFSLFFRHLLWLSTTACNFPNSTWSLIMMLMNDDDDGDYGDCNGDDAGLVVIMTVKRFQSEVGTFPLGFVLKKCGFLAALFL